MTSGSGLPTPLYSQKRGYKTQVCLLGQKLRRVKVKQEEDEEEEEEEVGGEGEGEEGGYEQGEEEDFGGGERAADCNGRPKVTHSTVVYTKFETTQGENIMI